MLDTTKGRLKKKCQIFTVFLIAIEKKNEKCWGLKSTPFHILINYL